MRVKKEAIIFLIFFLIGILSRALFASKDFTHMDGVLYAIGTFDFSIKNGTPPAPGYFLYIMSAKLLNTFTHNPYASLMYLSIFYSGLIAGMFYYFGTLLKGQMAGIVSGVLFLTSPLFWYKGISIFGYLNSGFFILLSALFGYKLIMERKRTFIFWFSVCFAILFGIRPQESIVMFPLYLFVLFHMRFKEAMLSIAIFLIFCLLWFIPFVSLSGGTASFLSALQRGDLVSDSIFDGNPISKINNHLVRMWQYFLWAYFLGIIPLIYYIGKSFYLPNFVNNKRTQFFAVWILPTIFYNIFIQFAEIGHGMSWGLGLLLIMGESVVVLCEDILKVLRNPRWTGTTYAFILSPIILTNFFMFYHDFDNGKVDFYSFEKYRQFNYQDVVKNNRFLISKINLIKKNIRPEETSIISSSTFSHQVMYRLPQAVVIQANIIDRRDNYGFHSFNYFKHSYYKEKKYFVIPEGISKLIVFDEIFMPYFMNKQNLSYLETEGAYKLLVYGVTAGQKILFDYHSIQVE